jgi:hypothetical protein
MFFLILFFAVLCQLAFSQTVSIQNVPDYNSLRPCAMNCIAVFSAPDILAAAMNCDFHVIENDCFCRLDLQPNAESILYNNVLDSCTNTLDANSAVSIYDTYCTSAGFDKNAAAASTTGTGTPTSNTPTTVTVTRVETVTVTSGQQRLKSPVEAMVQFAGF